MSRTAAIARHRAYRSAAAAIWRKAGALALGAVMLVSLPVTGLAQGAILIRDAEIENLMRTYSFPLMRAAGLNPGSVDVHLIADKSINAFVAGGQRIFIHTGLLLDAATPNEVIGVLAHEVGHIAGGHLARLQRQLDQMSTTAIIGMLLGAAAMAGGMASGSPDAARAGSGVMIGGQSLAMRGLLSYQRAQEAAADQAAVMYLDRTGQSAKGMLTLFEKLANQAIVSLQYADPYLQSHPMPRDRIQFLEQLARKSPNFDKEDSPELVLRHQLMHAKLRGYLQPLQSVLNHYPVSDTSKPARYARAVAYYRSGDLRNALSELEPLIAAMPDNPFFWELKGQAFFETGRVADAIAPLEKAVSLAPKEPLIRIMLAQAMLGTENARYTDRAIEHLRVALQRETHSVTLHRQLAIAYARKGEIGLAELQSAEASLLTGDIDLAKRQAARAVAQLKRGTPQWVKANDIVQLPVPDK